MNDEATNARAEAKAAKARAKALRPWFKKKRYWTIAIIAIVAIAAAASGGGDSGGSTSSGSAKSDQSPGEGGAVGKGLGTKDASADIDSIRCNAPDSIGIIYVDVKVTNRSSKPSDYFVTVVAESADGSVRYDDTIVMITALNPNQTTTEQGMFTKDLGAGAVCKVTEVQRTAS